MKQFRLRPVSAALAKFSQPRPSAASRLPGALAKYRGSSGSSGSSGSGGGGGAMGGTRMAPSLPRPSGGKSGALTKFRSRKPKGGGGSGEQPSGPQGGEQPAPQDQSDQSAVTGQPQDSAQASPQPQPAEVGSPGRAPEVAPPQGSALLDRFRTPPPEQGRQNGGSVRSDLTDQAERDAAALDAGIRAMDARGAVLAQLDPDPDVDAYRRRD